MKTLLQYLYKTNFGRIISLVILLVLSCIIYNVTGSQFVYDIILILCGVFATAVLAITGIGFYNWIASLRGKE